MTDLERSLHAIVAALVQRQARYAVVGGLAVAVRAEPRLTRDADLAVAVVDDAEAERLVAGLRVDGYHAFAAVEHEQSGRLATVRLSRPGDELGTVTDLLFASSGIEAEIVAEATAIEVLPGLTLPVATVGHLIVMKSLARDDRRRPADADDLVGLAAIATDADWEQALHAAQLVIERGYARQRDLVALIEQLRANPTWSSAIEKGWST